MGSIENDRIPELPHDREGPHIHDKVVVAEGRSSLGQHDPLTPALFDLFDGVSHFGRREKLALLYVDDLSRLGGRDQEIRLPTEKRRNLQNIHDLPGLRRLLFGMDVGQQGQSQLLLTCFNTTNPFLSPDLGMNGWMFGSPYRRTT